MGWNSKAYVQLHTIEESSYWQELKKDKKWIVMGMTTCRKWLTSQKAINQSRKDISWW